MKHIYILVITFFISSLGFGQTTIYTQDFETLNSGYTASSTEGSTFIDVFNRIDASAATDGNIGGNSTFIWAVEDTNVIPATITLDQIDVTGYTDFTFSLDMIAHHFNDWDNTDTFSITYSLDGGSYQNLLWVRNNGSTFNQLPSLDTDFDGVGDCGTGTLPALTTGTSGCSTSDNTFSSFSSSVITLSGNSTLDITLSFEGLESEDEGIYLDNLTVEANTASGPTVGFDSSSSTENETNSTFNVNIPVTLSNYSADVDLSVSVNGSSTAEGGDYTLNTTTLNFTGNGSLNISLDINADADFDDETIILDIAETSATGITITTTQHTVTVIDDEVPSLIITEVADPDNADGRFVEIYNNGTVPIDLGSEQIYFVKSVNAGTSYSEIALTGTIQPNQFFVIANSSNLNTNYGFVADIGFNDANGNGDDAYALFYGGSRTSGTLLDIYGEIGVDGTGKDWEYEDSKAIRNNPKTTNPNATWTASEWTIASADVADMTPGALENEYRFDSVWKPRNGFTNSTVNDDVIIISNITANDDLVANNLEIRSGAEYIVGAGNSVSISNNIINDGDLSLESTSSQYSSLILDGTLTGTVNYERHVNTNANGNDLVSSPVVGETFDASFATNLLAHPTTSGEYAFGVFNNNSGAYENFNTTDNTALVSGVGYRAATDATPSVSFIGTVATADVPIGITVGTDPTFGKWNLIGNPFPSYLDFATFFAANSSQLDTNFEAIYGYNADTSVWTIWNQAIIDDTGVTEKITPGQGFFVAAAGSGTVNFTTAMRTTGASDDFIVGDALSVDVALAKLQLTKGTDSYTTAIYFNSNATQNLDPGYDAGAFGGDATGIFTELVQGNTGIELAIQALAYTDFNDVVVPLGIKATTGEQITISLDAATLTIPSSINVYLEDTVENSFTLLTSTDYVHTLANNMSSTGRYFVHFTNTTLSNPSMDMSDIIVFVNQDSKTLHINGVLDNTTTVSFFDLQGRQVLQHEISNSQIENTVNVNSLNTGLFIVTLDNDTQQKTQKVIIK